MTILDKFDAMLDMQRNMQHKLGYNIVAMSGTERSAYIKEYTMHCNHEMHEMLQEVPYFKPWKKYNEAYDLTKAKEELIDAWHMFMNVALALGFDSETFYAAYMNKYLVNLNRQKDTANYTKCVPTIFAVDDLIECIDQRSILGEPLELGNLYRVKSAEQAYGGEQILQLENINGVYSNANFRLHSEEAKQ